MSDQMTVAELMETLRTMPPNAPVVLQAYYWGYYFACGVEIKPITLGGAHPGTDAGPHDDPSPQNADKPVVNAVLIA